MDGQVPAVSGEGDAEAERSTQGFAHRHAVGILADWDGEEPIATHVYRGQNILVSVIIEKYGRGGYMLSKLQQGVMSPLMVADTKEQAIGYAEIYLTAYVEGSNARS